MTKDEALTLEALKYAASKGYGLRDMKIAPFTIKSDAALAQPELDEAAFEAALQKQFQRDYAGYAIAAAAQPTLITFKGGNAEWVMRITADRRIEVNEGVEVSEAAQKVLDALQNLLRPAAQPAQRKPLTINEITAIEEKVYMQTTHKGKPAFEYAHALIRAVEAAHDIKEKNNGT